MQIQFGPDVWLKEATVQNKYLCTGMAYVPVQTCCYLGGPSPEPSSKYALPGRQSGRRRSAATTGLGLLSAACSISILAR